MIVTRIFVLVYYDGNENCSTYISESGLAEAREAALEIAAEEDIHCIFEVQEGSRWWTSWTGFMMEGEE